MKLRLYFLFSLLLISLLVLPGCEKKAPEEAKPAALKPVDEKPAWINPKETRLAAIPENFEVDKVILFSAYGGQVVYAARNKEGKRFIVAGDKPSQPYDEVWTDNIALSADGQRLAYSGKKEGKWYFVLDGKVGRPNENTGSTLFSPDGRFVACELKNNGKWSIAVYDGEKEVYRSQTYSDTFRSPAFSPDSRLLVYELGDATKRIVFFLNVFTKKIIKERLYPEGERLGTISFSSNSSRVMCEVKKEGNHFLVLQDFALNDERNVVFPYIAAEQFVLSPDGNHIVTIASKEGKKYLVVSPWGSPAEGKERGPYDAIVSPVFGPDSKTVACLALKGGKWRSVAGDKEGAKYDVVGDVPLVFSPDGAKIAYRAMKKEGKWVMVVSPSLKPDAVKEGPAYDMVVTPVFSPDGRRIAYRARKGPIENGRRFIVIADAETGKVIKEGPVGDEIWPPVWSPDGKAAAYGARIGREFWWKVEKLREQLSLLSADSFRVAASSLAVFPWKVATSFMPSTSS